MNLGEMLIFKVSSDVTNRIFIYLFKMYMEKKALGMNIKSVNA